MGIQGLSDGKQSHNMTEWNIKDLAVTRFIFQRNMKGHILSLSRSLLFRSLLILLTHLVPGGVLNVGQDFSFIFESLNCLSLSSGVPVLTTDLVKQLKRGRHADSPLDTPTQYISPVH